MNVAVVGGGLACPSSHVWVDEAELSPSSSVEDPPRSVISDVFHGRVCWEHIEVVDEGM